MDPRLLHEPHCFLKDHFEGAVSRQKRGSVWYNCAVRHVNRDIPKGVVAFED
jgi:hypothetical protein